MKHIITAIIVSVLWFAFLLSYQARPDEAAEKHIAEQQAYITVIENQLKEYRQLKMYQVSAYCPGSCCCGEFADGFTASGQAAKGFFIAAPPDIPFGTLLAVPGYAHGFPVPVLDRGCAIKGNKLDVFFPTHQEALNWGVKYLKVRMSKGNKQDIELIEETK